jgi:4'-phosphopantetheinyl transferase EntD
VFAELAPPGVVVVETARPHAWEGEVETSAEALAAGVAEARAREFRIGRACARRALCKLGVHDTSVPTGRAREPIWPPGVVGSITHCKGYAAAAVAWSHTVTGLGIDVERNVALAPGIVRRIATPPEQAWLAAAPPCGLHWPVLIFSAKESIYKAWYPLTGRFLGFLEVELRIEPASKTFSADLDAGLRAFGRFSASAAHVFTLARLEPATLKPTGDDQHV